MITLQGSFFLRASDVTKRAMPGTRGYSGIRVPGYPGQPRIRCGPVRLQNHVPRRSDMIQEQLELYHP
eukprot:2254680-Rhodomonas_salina.1